MITDSIKSYIAGAIAFLLLMILIPTGIENYSLKEQVKQLEADKTTLKAEALQKRMEIQGLVDAIADQNKRITDFENTTKKMAEVRLQVQRESAQRIDELTGHIAWLEHDKGASCNAAGIGQTILNEVLR